MSKDDEPFLDISNVHKSRKTLRSLIVCQAVCMVALLITSISFSLPETVQLAMELESEVVPRWRSVALLLAVIGMLVLYVWGAVELWHLKSSGFAKYVVPVFAPLFLLDPTPAVATGLQDYISGLDTIFTGMILFMCWTIPAMFEDRAEHEKAGTASPAVQLENGNA